MSSIYQQLAELCAKNLCGEKVLVMSSYAQGNLLLKGYAAKGYRGLNLKVETIMGLAQNICSSLLYAKNLTCISDTLAGHIMYGILKDLKEKQNLKYFQRLEVTPGMAKGISRAILELKTAGFSSGGIPGDSFVSEFKEDDLRIIFQGYEKVLRSQGYIDRGDLLAMAAAELEKARQGKGEEVSRTKTQYMCPSNLRLNSLEKKLLDGLVRQGSGTVFTHSHPYGLSMPPGYFGNYFNKDSEDWEKGAENPLSWLYDLDRLPKGSFVPEVQMFRAYGENSEVKEVIRRIKERSLPFDRTMVFFTTVEPYTQLFYQAALQYGLPVTFGEGISIGNTRPGRFFGSIMDWLEKNFNVLLLCRMLLSPDFELKRKKGPSKNEIAGVLRASGIGWGRERYLSWLDQEVGRYRGRLEKGRAKRSYKLEKIQWIRNFMKDFLGHIPEPMGDNRIDINSFMRGIFNLIEAHAAVSGEADVEAKNFLLEELSVPEGISGEPVTIEEAIFIAREMAGGLRVQASLPQPGFLHLESYRKGLWLSRENNFIMGMDASRFPGQSMEDPLLLDVEREKLGRGLVLNKSNAAEKLYAMAQLLASLRGRITLSYASFDTVESREVFPSPVLLQVHRLMNGDKSRDYSALLKEIGLVKGFVPEKYAGSLDEGEWWLHRFLRGGGVKNPLRTVSEVYPFLKRGYQAQVYRKGEEFTSYDGKLASEENIMKDRMVFSASQLERLGQCPYAYFLRYVLGISPPEEIQYVPGMWLDPAVRGILLHRVYEDFYREMVKRGETPSFRQHQQLLVDMVERLIEEQKSQLPPPNEVVLDYERREIMESSHIFLKSEEEFSRNLTPCYFELTFGIPFLMDEELGQIEPVKIQLPADRYFFLRGKIDRVDRGKDGSYRVLDYKTGGTSFYKNREPHRGGRQLQHTLYALALEEILRMKNIEQNPRVTEGGYAFPTLKGEGKRIMRDQGDRREFFEIMEILLEIYSRGIFVMTDDDKDCFYCDYPDVCRRRFYGEELKNMVASSRNKELTHFRRLRSYD